VIRKGRNNKIEDIGRVKTLTLRKLDVSSSDSNSVSITQSNFYNTGGKVGDSGKVSSGDSNSKSKKSGGRDYKENMFMVDSDSEMQQSHIKSSGAESDGVV